MKFKLNERGFILAEFVMAVPILILLLYVLGTLTLKTARIAREQVADYVLETEAQEVIDRITRDARAAQTVKVSPIVGSSDLYEIIFEYSTLDVGQAVNYPQKYRREVIDTRRYTVDNFHVIAKRVQDNYNSNPITGGNSYGDTKVTKLKFTEPAKNVLHITLEIESLVTNQKVKFTTAVYMPACKNFKISL